MATEVHFDESLSFVLPRGYEAEKGVDEDGKSMFQILYGISYNSDGEREVEKSFQVMPAPKKERQTLKSNIDSNYPVNISGFAKDFSINMSVRSSSPFSSSTSNSSNSSILFKIFTGVAIVEYKDRWCVISNIRVGQDDYQSRKENAEEIAADLTTVLGFIHIDGVPLKIKTVPASLVKNGLMKEELNVDTAPEVINKQTEEQRRAEEEKRRQEEAERKRKAEEEKRAVEAAKAKIENEQKAWEREAASIRAERDRKYREKADVIEKEKREYCARAAQEKQENLTKCEEEIAAKTSLISEKEKELGSLGIFVGKRKKELRKEIEDSQNRLQELNALKDTIQQKYSEKVNSANKQAQAKKDEARKTIEKQYPIPESPAEKARRNRQLSAEEAQEEIINALANASKPLSIQEIIDAIGVNTLTPQRVMAILHRLSREEYVGYEFERDKKLYFLL